jgi:hypothetical protein
VLLSKVVIPVLAQAETVFAATLARITVEDLSRSAKLHGLGGAATQQRRSRHRGASNR